MKFIVLAEPTPGPIKPALLCGSNCESVADAEGFEFTGGGIGFGIDVADVAVHFLAKTLKDAVHLAVIAFQDELNPAIGKVANISMNGIAHCNILRGVSKADTLNPTVEVNDATMHLETFHGVGSQMYRISRS
jgi:hypothetical protein